MFTASRAAAVFAFLGAAVNGATIKARSECATIDTGFPVIFVEESDGYLEGLRLTGDNVTFSTGQFFNAHFEACADLPESVTYNSVGRIVIEPSSDNKCLTIANAESTTGPWYAKSETCSSNTEPSAAQTFGYGNDFGNVIVWNTDCGYSSGGAGIAVDDNGIPALGAGNTVQFSCLSTSTSSYETFTFNPSPYVDTF